MSVLYVCANLNGSYVFHVLQRLPFTAGFIASMAATIYVSMVMHSYILSVAFSGIQVCSTPSLPSLLFSLCVNGWFGRSLPCSIMSCLTFREVRLG